MKKALLLALAVSVGLVLSVSRAPASIDGGGGPTCADITNDSSILSYDATTQTLSFVVGTAAPSCHQFTYTVNVYSDNDPSHPFIANGSANGTGDVDVTGVPFLIVDIANVVPLAASYCIAATSSVGPKHVFDRAPDTGCISFPVEFSGGQNGFN